MSRRVFVDETKRRNYVLVAVSVPTEDLDSLRKIMRGLVLPGQRRLHMKDENDRRRRSIATAIAASGVAATVYDAGQRGATERDRRTACLQRLVADVADGLDTIIVLEQDDTLMASDRRVLYAATRQDGCVEAVRYEHSRAGAEHLLSIPDAIAWSWARGGEWRRRIEPVIKAIREV